MLSQCPRRGLDAATALLCNQVTITKGHRNARAGAWTLRLTRLGRCALPLSTSQCPRRGLDAATTSGVHEVPTGTLNRNARAGAWTLRLAVRRAVSIVPLASQCPHRGLDAATNRMHDACCPERLIAMPAQGLGRCDPWAFALATQSYPDRNARAGAWTLTASHDRLITYRT